MTAKGEDMPQGAIDPTAPTTEYPQQNKEQPTPEQAREAWETAFPARLAAQEQAFQEATRRAQLEYREQSRQAQAKVAELFPALASDENYARWLQIDPAERQALWQEWAHDEVGVPHGWLDEPHASKWEVALNRAMETAKGQRDAFPDLPTPPDNAIQAALKGRPELLAALVPGAKLANNDVGEVERLRGLLADAEKRAAEPVRELPRLSAADRATTGTPAQRRMADALNRASAHRR